MQFFLPMNPPTVTHHDKELHAYLKDGRPRAVLHDSARLLDAKAKLRAALLPHRPAKPLEGPVRLVVKWCFADPEGCHRDGEYKVTKPDTDNLDKALKDQMTRLGFWADDAQVASEISEKFWSGTPGIFIQAEALDV